MKIVSPASGAEVDTGPKVHGTAALVNGQQLYFFTYAPAICMYFFDPWAAVRPAADGSWSVRPNVSANAGGEIVFMAAVVDPEGQLLLREVLAAPHPEDGPYLQRLPDGTRVAHITVRVKSQ